eukprot:488428_1
MKKIMIKKTNQMIINENKKIKHQKYKQFFKIIDELCTKNKYLPGWHKIYNYNQDKIQLMITDNDLSASTFSLWTKDEFCELVEKYYCTNNNKYDKTEKSKIITLWEQVNTLLNTDDSFGLENAVELWKNNPTKQIKQECEDLIEKIGFYGYLYYENCDDKNNNEEFKTLMKLGINMLNKNIEKYPSDAYFYFLRAKCYLYVDDLANAKTDFDKAYELNNNEPIFVYYIGYIADKLG